ncbi:UxaA family hydrolase [Roseivivax sp. CAU 1761]
MTRSLALRLHDADNVLIVLDSVEHGTSLAPFETSAHGLVPRGHKVALDAIPAGAEIRKYGQVIGRATRDIRAGEHVHTQNAAMADHARDHRFGRLARATELVPAAERATFQGYRRPDGKIGTRNYVGIVTSVNCSAGAARLIAREAEKRGLLDLYPNVDGIVPITHGAGCCIGTDDEAFRKLQRTIWGYATHANFASVLMLGLGCEANQIPLMLEVYGNPPPERFRYHVLQDEGGTRRTVELGLEWLEAALAHADTARRETVPASELVVALQCGGSDGYSGITSNPALGHAVDLLVRNGGTAALAETPEIYGAEHLLTDRAATPEVARKLVALIDWWKDYAARHGSEMNNNPTPGNKAGGLTTILEKSLGAVAKAGSTNLNGVYGYGEPITARGLVFVDSPGYDPVSITGQVASGCTMVCFTTGRGSCYGNKPAPSIKIASNSPMFDRMRDDMDLNCGTITDGTESVAEAGARIFAEMLAVASGKRTLSEVLDLGEAEFAPWQTYAQM